MSEHDGHLLSCTLNFDHTWSCDPTCSMTAPEATDPTPGEVGLSEVGTCSNNFVCSSVARHHTDCPKAPLPPVAAPPSAKRAAAMEAAAHEVSRDFIVEALSWAETTADGRLGHERSEALLAAHEQRILAARTADLRAERDALRNRMETLADEFDAKGRRGSAHFGADVGDTIRLWLDRDPRAALTAHRHEEA